MKIKELVRALFYGLGTLCIFSLIIVLTYHLSSINKYITYSIVVGLIIACLINLFIILFFGILNYFYEEMYLDGDDIVLREWEND